MNWIAVDQAREGVIAQIPEGWFTRQDYQTKYGMKQGCAREQIRKLMMAGKLQSKTVNHPKGGLIPIYTPTVQSESCPTAQKSKRTRNR